MYQLTVPYFKGGWGIRDDETRERYPMNTPIRGLYLKALVAKTVGAALALHALVMMCGIPLIHLYLHPTSGTTPLAIHPWTFYAISTVLWLMSAAHAVVDNHRMIDETGMHYSLRLRHHTLIGYCIMRNSIAVLVIVILLIPILILVRLS